MGWLGLQNNGSVLVFDACGGRVVIEALTVYVVPRNASVNVIYTGNPQLRMAEWPHFIYLPVQLTS